MAMDKEGNVLFTNGQKCCINKVEKPFNVTTWAGACGECSESLGKKRVPASPLLSTSTDWCFVHSTGIKQCVRLQSYLKSILKFSS